MAAFELLEKLRIMEDHEFFEFSRADTDTDSYFANVEKCPRPCRRIHQDSLPTQTPHDTSHTRFEPRNGIAGRFLQFLLDFRVLFDEFLQGACGSIIEFRSNSVTLLRRDCSAAA